jgi:hypothetical protein
MEVSWNAEDMVMRIYGILPRLHSTVQENDLGGVLDFTVGDSEGVDGPVQVESVLSLAEWQTFSQCSLIDLDNLQRTISNSMINH